MRPVIVGMLGGGVEGGTKVVSEVIKKLVKLADIVTRR